jgi:hypothetical protein
MTSESTLFDGAELTQPLMQLSETVQQQLWQDGQSFATPQARYQAYLNQLCVEAVLPWLQTVFSAPARPWPNRAALPSFWEIVNGVPLSVGGKRLVCLPSEAIDLSELCVPQEWVDCPSWVADYYLAVQVEPDQGWVKVWGYCNHQMLKQRGQFDSGDRTYRLDETELITDMGVLKVAQQLCPNESTRSPVSPLPQIPQSQADKLLQRLGKSSLLTPRLDIPFALWGALVEHGGWRKRLYELRSGQPEQWSIRQWIAQGISEIGQQLGWQRLVWNAAIGGARGRDTAARPIAITRTLMIDHQAYALNITHLSDRGASTWRFELSAATPGKQIPEGFALSLLTEDLQPFENNTDTAATTVESLWVEIALEDGEGLVWEVKPWPEDYDREILLLWTQEPL